MHEGPNNETSEFGPRIEGIVNLVERACGATLKNSYGNEKYRFYADDPQQSDEAGRIVVSSITQYAPDSEVGETGELVTVGPADFDYSSGGEYGSGQIIFRKQADGALSWEITGDLTDQQEIEQALTSAMGSGGAS